MTAEPGGGDYIVVDGIKIWWQAAHPSRIHYVTSDDSFADAGGERLGLRVVFSSDPLSADYSPANFNRCARALRREGKSAPDADVPELPRELARRLAGPLTLRESYVRP